MGTVIATALGVGLGYWLGHNLAKRPEWVKAKFDAAVERVSELIKRGRQ